MSYSQYLQSPEGTYISSLTAGTIIADTISNGEGLISSFAANSTSIQNTNITAFPYNIYCNRIGEFVDCQIISGTVPVVADEDVEFSITYPPPITRLNVDDTTAGGQGTAEFNDLNISKNPIIGISSHTGQNNITFKMISPAGCSTCVLRASFKLKMN